MQISTCARTRAACRECFVSSRREKKRREKWATTITIPLAARTSITHLLSVKLTRCISPLEIAWSRKSLVPRNSRRLKLSSQLRYSDLSFRLDGECSLPLNCSHKFLYSCGSYCSVSFLLFIYFWCLSESYSMISLLRLFHRENMSCAYRTI